MDFLTVLFIALGIAIDTCLIGIEKGMVIKSSINRALIVAVLFSGFQATMALAGWLLGISLQTFVSTLASWITFILVLFIGIKMVYRSFLGSESDSGVFRLKEIFTIAITISIDAFLVGISFALSNTPVVLSALTIGIVAFILSLSSFYIGKQVRYVFGRELRFLSGLLLIVMGFFILTG